MSSKRAPSPPPLIDGFEYVSVIGSGGFSDVFLYQQQRPRRRVAVKVLLHEWSSESQRAAFDVEADLMATLSTHPSIVTMYEADVASDGRPYLAMEYCSRPNLGARYRSERLSVAETLRIAVQIAGAVETAHRAGILHRDIKPANILVTEYGHPALTDFGISSTMDDASRAEGMSIPWSPPESFAENPWAGKETDVWALAATTYTLLAGRAPFELPGGSNSSASLITRIESTPLLPTGRTDVPASLERVLGTAMAKNPASRYPTMLAFARALQQVQNELSYAVTPIDVLADTGLTQEDEPDDDGGTRLRAMVSIDPRGTGGGQGGPKPGSMGTPGRTTTGTAPVVRLDPAAGHPDPHAPVTSSGRAQLATAPAAAAYQGTPPATPTYAAPSQAPAPGGYVPARPVPGTRPGEGPAPSGWGTPVEDTVHRVRPQAEVEPEPQEQVARRARWPLLVAAGVLLLVVVGIYFLLPDGTATDPDADAGGGTTQGEEPADLPNDNLGDLVPQVVGIETWYDEGQGAATFDVELPSDWKEGTDTLAVRRVDDPLVTNAYEETPFTRVAVEAPATERVCLEIVVKREGKMSEPTRGCVPE
ncbi:serine/threonine-protein kinase [Oerskovia jenensis]|uniref:serine/threonine-protein kinase n=1 Tax=Oerskovia jenensis TaxID=162169 RepID=UPI0036DD3C07